MSLPLLTPEQVAEKCKNGAILIDIRAKNEHQQRHIPNALSIPLDDLPTSNKQPEHSILIFHCLSGVRTQANATLLAQYAQGCEAYILDGGLNAWQNNGLPTEGVARCHLDIMRQVQIVAGSLILLGGLLGVVVSPWFFALCILVGMGLLFAGLTGFCGMAKLLAKMPWNQA